MKIAIVTGASKGIGKEIKNTLENNGYTVVGTYNKTQTEGLVKCDLSKPEEIKDLVEYTAEKYGKIDLVVNCAGVSLCGVVQDISEEEIIEQTEEIADESEATANTESESLEDVISEENDVTIEDSPFITGGDDNE